MAYKQTDQDQMGIDSHFYISVCELNASGL